MKAETNSSPRSQLMGSLAGAAGMLALAFGAQVAREMDYIDQDTVKRVVTCAIGLLMAWYGNGLPKAIVRVGAPACARQAQRVVAWSLTLSGLIYAGLWAFAPIATAVSAGAAVVLLGVAVSLGYCVTLLTRARAA